MPGGLDGAGPDWGAQLNDLLREIALLDARQRRTLFASLPVTMQRVVDESWKRWAHEGQYPDKGDWRVWLIQAGRGYGKTRAGSEWVSELARDDGSLRFLAGPLGVSGEFGRTAICCAGPQGISNQTRPFVSTMAMAINRWTRSSHRRKPPKNALLFAG